MPGNYEHYITKNIKEFYKRRLFAPIVYLLLLLILWQVFSLSSLISPDPLPADQSLETAYRNHLEYVSVTLTDLKFTGYTQTVLGQTTGYYYYTTRADDECVLVLLSPKTSEEGLPSIDQVSIHAAILNGGDSYESLLTSLVSDLNWTENGIHNTISLYYISEPGFHQLRNIILFAAIFATGGYALLCLILSVLYLFFPVLSPACQDLALFGNPKKLLEQAEEELATLPQLATEDMFITEHFFIETSIYGNAIVQSMRSSGSINTRPCTNSSGTISAFPIRCTSVPTSICICNVRKISNPILMVSWTTLPRQTTISWSVSARKTA